LSLSHSREQHGAAFLFMLEVLDVAQGLTSAAFVQMFPCVILFPIIGIWTM